MFLGVLPADLLRVSSITGGAGAQHEARCEAPHQEHHENEQ